MCKRAWTVTRHHSMFWTCSRSRSIAAFMREADVGELQRPLALAQSVLASRLNSWQRKSSLRRPPHSPSAQKLPRSRQMSHESSRSNSSRTSAFGSPAAPPPGARRSSLSGGRLVQEFSANWSVELLAEAFQAAPSAPVSRASVDQGLQSRRGGLWTQDVGRAARPSSARASTSQLVECSLPASPVHRCLQPLSVADSRILFLLGHLQHAANQLQQPFQPRQRRIDPASLRSSCNARILGEGDHLIDQRLPRSSRSRGLWRLGLALIVERGLEVHRAIKRACSALRKTGSKASVRSAPGGCADRSPLWFTLTSLPRPTVTAFRSPPLWRAKPVMLDIGNALYPVAILLKTPVEPCLPDCGSPGGLYPRNARIRTRQQDRFARSLRNPKSDPHHRCVQRYRPGLGFEAYARCRAVELFAPDGPRRLVRLACGGRRKGGPQGAAVTCHEASDVSVDRSRSYESSGPDGRPACALGIW